MEINASNHITLKNILIGDVWVCSGQSNMELPMDRVKYKYPDVIAHSDNPSIRQFIVPHIYDFQDTAGRLGIRQLGIGKSQNVLEFTAVGYFFAKELYEKYHVPIGLINASLGRLARTGLDERGCLKSVS